MRSRRRGGVDRGGDCLGSFHSTPIASPRRGGGVPGVAATAGRTLGTLTIGQP